MDALTIAEASPHEDDEPQISSDVRSEPENKFQRAISAWRGINLSQLIAQLDTTASEILNSQKDALVERKEVAQKTKDFRKLDDTAKLSEIKPLLKSKSCPVSHPSASCSTYQTFIDLLTTHNKTSTSGFLQIYTPLSDVPDPFPLLEASVEALVASEDTLPKVSAENDELKKRVTKLSAQLEETEKKLQDESQARREVDAGSGEQIKEVEAGWNKVLEEKQSNWDAKERALEDKVEHQDRLLKELKASYEVAQRLGVGGDEDADEAAAQGGVYGKAAAAEIDMLQSEFEKASSRLAEIEARNEQLRLDLARATSQNAAHPSRDDEAELLRLRSENSSLLRKIESARFDKDAEKRDWDNRLRLAERQRSQLSTEVHDMRGKLQKCADYDDLKRELDVLRSIELSVEDDGDDFTSGRDTPQTDLTTAVATNGSADKHQSLEQLLLSKNKKLSSEMTLLRVAHQDTQSQFADLQEELSRTNAELETAQKLAATLENDLVRVQEEAAANANHNHGQLPSSGMSVAGGTYSSRFPTGSLRRGGGGGGGGRASPTSSIISGYDTGTPLRSSGSATLESLRAGDPVGGGSGILPMVQAQRDRFKTKNQQLEEELQKTYATVTSLRQEVASLQKDNLSLYEKSRYVSAYSRGGNTSSSGSGYAGGVGHTQRLMHHAGEDPDDDAAGTDQRWKSQYESHLSPFAAFRGREASRAYKRMSFLERMVFSLTRIVLATRASRNIFACYCVGLHLLVFYMLYWTGTADIERHAVGEIGSIVAGAAVAGPAKEGGAAMGEAGSEWQQEGFG